MFPQTLPGLSTPAAAHFRKYRHVCDQCEFLRRDSQICTGGDKNVILQQRFEAGKCPRDYWHHPELMTPVTPPPAPIQPSPQGEPKRPLRVSWWMNDLAQGGLTRYMADSIPYMHDPLVKPDSILFRFCYHVDMQSVRELAPHVKLYCTADDPAELAKAPPELWRYAVRSGPDLYQQCFDAVDIVNLVALAPVCKIPDIVRTNPTASGNPTRFVFQCHGCCGWTDQCIRYNRGRSDHYHAVSNAVALHLNKNHGIPLDDITVIEAGINRTRILPTLDYDDARTKFLREANQFVEADMNIQYAIMQAPWLLFYGRLSPEKGLHTLAASIDQMIDLASEFRLPYEPDIQQWLSRAILLVVGDGWDAVNQLRILRDTLPTRSVYLPWTDNVGNVLEASDLFVCLSDSEGGPMTTVEALMNGVLVLSTPVGLTTDLRYTTRTGLNRTMARIITGQSTIAEQIAAALVESRTAEWEQEKLQISWLVTRRFNPYLKARQWTDYFKGLAASPPAAGSYRW